MNLHHFPYFDPTKNYYKFQRHSLMAALYKKKICVCAKRIFGFWFLASLKRRVDEIKYSKSENFLKLPRPLFAQYHRIFNFSGTP